MDSNPDLCNAKPTPSRRCGAPPPLASASGSIFVLRAIDRLGDPTAHSADPVLTLLISGSVAVALGAVAEARQGSWTDRVGLPSPYWAFRQRRAHQGATDAALVAPTA